MIFNNYTKIFLTIGTTALILGHSSLAQLEPGLGGRTIIQPRLGGGTTVGGVTRPQPTVTSGRAVDTRVFRESGVTQPRAQKRVNPKQNAVDKLRGLIDGVVRQLDREIEAKQKELNKMKLVRNGAASDERVLKDFDPRFTRINAAAVKRSGSAAKAKAVKEALDKKIKAEEDELTKMAIKRHTGKGVFDLFLEYLASCDVDIVLYIQDIVEAGLADGMKEASKAGFPVVDGATSIDIDDTTNQTNDILSDLASDLQAVEKNAVNLSDDAVRRATTRLVNRALSQIQNLAKSKGF